MGCLSSKESKDSVEPEDDSSDDPPAGDHGSLTGADEGKKKSARDRAAGSGTGDAAKPVPIGRSFHEDIPSPGSGPANVLKKRVIPSRDANEGADVAGSDDELEAQLRAPSAPSPTAAAAAEEEAAAEAKRKKKKDKNRLTDLEDYDLEAEDPDTTEEMLRKRASRRAGESKVMQKVFGDIDDFSDEDTPRGVLKPLTPRVPLTGPGAGPLGSKTPLFGTGPLVPGAGARKSGLAPLAPLGAPPAPLGGAAPLDAPAMGSFLAPVRRANSRPITPIEPEPVVREGGDLTRAERDAAEPEAAAPDPADDGGDFEWRDDEADPAVAPDPADDGGDFEWRDDEADPAAAPDPADDGGDFEWRDDEAGGDEAGEDDVERHAAATKLQAAHRGKAARSKVARLKAELAEAALADPGYDEDEFEAEGAAPGLDEHAAATRLQAVQRGRAARAEVARLKSEIRRAEAETEPRDAVEDAYEDEFEDEFETEDAGGDDAERHAAATKLQAAHRGKAARSKVARLKAELAEAVLAEPERADEAEGATGEDVAELKARVRAAEAESQVEDEYEDEFETEESPAPVDDPPARFDRERAPAGPDLLEELYGKGGAGGEDAFDAEDHFYEPDELETPAQTPRPETNGGGVDPSADPDREPGGVVENPDDVWGGLQQSYAIDANAGDATLDGSTEGDLTPRGGAELALDKGASPHPADDAFRDEGGLDEGDGEGWAEGAGLDDGLEAGGEVDYDDFGELEDAEEDDVF
jgi:hypothetical protein